LKKIKHAFDPVLQKRSSYEEKAVEKEVDIMETEKRAEEEILTDSTQESQPIAEMYCDLFSQENICRSEH